MSGDLFGSTGLPSHVTTSDLAFLLGITPRRIAQLVREGMPKERRDTYKLTETVQWYTLQLKGGRADARNVEEQRRELLYEQTVKTRLENDTNRKRLIPAELVAGVHNRMAAELSASLDALASRLAGNLAGISDISEVKTLLFTETRRIRDGFATGIIDSIEHHIAELDSESESVDT